MKTHWRASLLALCALLAVPAAHAVVDDNADVVLVRESCAGLDDCFTNLQSAMSWTWNTRNPTATDRLVIELGPGEWYDQFYCQNNGYVTLRGSGRDASIVRGHQGNPQGGELGLKAAVEVHNCTDLEFIAVGFESEDYTVYWSGPGESVWTDVDIVNPGTGGATVGWYEDKCSAGTPQGLHYFFGSRIETHGRKQQFGLVPATAYWSKCSESWYYGGEIHWIVDEISASPGAAVLLNGHSNFHAFGTAIRATVPDGVIGVGDLIGVSVSDAPGWPGTPSRPAIFHMHGGIISVNASSQSFSNAIGVKVDGATAFAHVPETAFAVNSPGSTTRLQVTNSGTVDSPFLWTTGTQPPKATSETGGIASVKGQDLFVETDCGSDGNCAGGGTDPHLMIYSEDCGAGNPWFDVVAGACRSLTSP